jgi:HK97 family phage prohead protease
LTEDVPEGRACGNCFFYNEDMVQDDKAWCERWDDYVRGDHYCNAWQSNEEDRQIDLDVPQYIRDAAAKGLEYYAQGLAGDGLVSATVREARALARGEVSEDKVVRAAAWGARHAPDLDAPQNSNATNDEFPGAGAVAHYLWGINPLSPASARNWFERKSQQIQAERALGAPAFIANMRAKDSLGVDMKQAVEVREVQFSDIEMRQTEDAPGDVPMTFRGYAAVFNSPSEDMGFREYIKPGAFAKSLKSRNSIRMFMNHNSDIVLASTRAKTLRLIEDDKGLLVDADLPDTTAGRDLSVLLQRGDVDSMSFGFSVPPKGETWSDDGSTRELHAVRLHEVSVVTGWPAYPATSASVRSFEILAERTNTNADELAEAITLLENGAELDSARADLLNEVVSKLRQEPPTSLLGLKQKHLDLLAKTI